MIYRWAMFVDFPWFVDLPMEKSEVSVRDSETQGPVLTVPTFGARRRHRREHVIANKPCEMLTSTYCIYVYHQYMHACIYIYLWICIYVYA